MNEQLFWGYKSKYLDLYDKVISDHHVDKASILDDVILSWTDPARWDQCGLHPQIAANLERHRPWKAAQGDYDLIGRGGTFAQAKRELDRKIYPGESTLIPDSDDIPDAFDKFWNEEQIAAFKQTLHDENLSSEKVEKTIENYLFAEREPLRGRSPWSDKRHQTSVLDRKKIGDRILNKILRFGGYLY